MKITLYTVSDCKFSASEKAYLQGKSLAFEEKNLETNKENLTEMLNLSNNFAGTPVTKIEKDDGQILVLKGFTQEEFDNALGFSSPTPVTQAEAVQPVVDMSPQNVTEPVAPGTNEPVVATPSEESMPMTIPVETTPISSALGTNEGLSQDLGRDTTTPSIASPVSDFSSQSAMGSMPQTPAPAPTQADLNNSLNSVLNDLQVKSEGTQSQQPPTNTNAPTPPQTASPTQTPTSQI